MSSLTRILGTGLLMVALFSAVPVLAECRVELTDLDSGIKSMLSARDLGDGSFVVVNKAGTPDEYQVEAAFDPETKVLSCRSGIPPISYDDLLVRVQPELASLNAQGIATTRSNLVWRAVAGYRCADIEFALIHYLVLEWFYFG